MSNTTSQLTPGRRVERLLAIAGGVICIAVSMVLGQMVAGQQPIWPLPGIYFIELMALGFIAMWGLLRGDELGGKVTWLVIGALLTFVVLGAWSIGLQYVPVTLVFVIASVAADWRRRANLWLHLTLAITGSALQAAIMFVMITAGPVQW